METSARSNPARAARRVSATRSSHGVSGPLVFCTSSQGRPSAAACTWGLQARSTRAHPRPRSGGPPRTDGRSAVRLWPQAGTLWKPHAALSGGRRLGWRGCRLTDQFPGGGSLRRSRQHPPKSSGGQRQRRCLLRATLGGCAQLARVHPQSGVGCVGQSGGPRASPRGREDPLPRQRPRRPQRKPLCGCRRAPQSTKGRLSQDTGLCHHGRRSARPHPVAHTGAPSCFVLVFVFSSSFKRSAVGGSTGLQCTLPPHRSETTPWSAGLCVCPRSRQVCAECPRARDFGSRVELTAPPTWPSSWGPGSWVTGEGARHAASLCCLRPPTPDATEQTAGPKCCPHRRTQEPGPRAAHRTQVDTTVQPLTPSSCRRRHRLGEAVTHVCPQAAARGFSGEKKLMAHLLLPSQAPATKGASICAGEPAPGYRHTCTHAHLQGISCGSSGPAHLLSPAGPGSPTFHSALPTR